MRLVVASCLSTLLGFLALSYEILWVRIYGFVSGGTAHAFGFLLGTYLLGIAAGSWVSRRWCIGEGGRGSLRALGGAVLLSNLGGVLLVPAVAELVRSVPHQLTYPLVTGVAGCFGMGLPLVSHFGIPADRRTGARLGSLYFGNICGSAAGGLTTGLVLLDHWTLGEISSFLALLGFVTTGGILLLARPLRRAQWIGLGLAAGGALLTPLAVPPLFDGVYEKLQLKGEYQPGVRFVRVIENKSGVITVDAAGAVYGGGAYDGRFNVDLARDTNWIVRAYALAAMHPDPREVLVVGLGSGSWTQVLVHHPAVRRLTVVEINPGYRELVRDHPLVRSLLRNPKVEIIIDDGRRYLQATARR
ncbi:MAG: spermidine synthase, partial [Planctomycetota bacterium]